MNDPNNADRAPTVPVPSWRLGCAGTEPSVDGPREAPATAEVDGPLLCVRRAEEFWALARADVAEVAALYPSRLPRIAWERPCGDELVRRPEAAREGSGAETERALQASERAGGKPRRCPPRPTGFGGRGTDPRTEGDGTSSTACAEDAAGLRRDRRGVGARRGARLGGGRR